MKGAVGSYIYSASIGAASARRLVDNVFCDSFKAPKGWNEMLDNMPGRSVETMLNRKGAWWKRECFQALYVACWIHHPVEKGSYMIQLSPTHRQNVTDAYTQLLQNGGLQSRISSHLSLRGASAHEGWEFLQGYGELLVQVEGTGAPAAYLFLKCEGHALESGLSVSTIMHGASLVLKEITGAGATASEALKEWASFALAVEGRAAENFSKVYEKLIKQLDLSGTMVTVEQVVEALFRKAGFNAGLPGNVRNNTTALGNAMLGHGYISFFKKQRAVLQKNGVDFSEKVEKELYGIAKRMTATSTSHTQQHFNEIRVTPAELDLSLATFRQFVP